MAYIYKVQKGCVHTLNQSGCQVRPPFHPSFGGDAIFVDYNSNLKEFIVTTDGGFVIFYNESFCHISSFGAKDAIMARWQGNDILVQFKNGSCILYNQYGCKLRYL